MDKIRRNERMSAMMKILAAKPNRIFTLSYFCDLFGSAKSTMSEDIDILRDVVAHFGLGELETVTGAAGGVRYRTKVRRPEARKFIGDLCQQLVDDFDHLPIHEDMRKPRVGIVGEILLKYHPAANLGIVQEIIDEGAEPVLGDLAAFFLYCLYDHINQAKVFGGPRLKAMGAWLMIRWFEHLRGIMRKALDGTPVAGVSTLAEDLERIDGLVSAGQEAGEGWLLTAEMVEFIHSGTPNVVCLQPFGCLPNHVTGKGVIRRLREENPLANICAIDFEAGTSKTNVSNRLKLFLAQARENFERGIAVDEPVPTAHRIIPITPSANIAVDAAESPHKDRGGGQAAC